MNISQMRRIDFYFGIPICLLLDLFNKFTRPFTSRPFSFNSKSKEVREILIMKYFGIGSIILSSPMVKALKSKFPHAKITYLTFHNNSDIVEMYNLADYIVTIRTSSFNLFLRDVIKAIFIFWRRRIDIAIDLEFFSKFSTIMTYLSGAPTRVGFYLRQLWRGDLLTHQVYYNPYHHISEVFLALSQAIEVDANNLHIPRPIVKKEDKKFVDDLLFKKQLSPKNKIICINVNVGEMCIERRWPLNNFVKLADELNKINAAMIIFIGSEKDILHTDNVINSLEVPGKVIKLAGILNLKQLAALFERTDLFISSDSGPLHLAASLGVPTVSFFGPEIPVLYGPVGDNHMVFYKNLYCSPCLNVYNVKTAMYGDKRCFEGENKCMRAITAEEVLEIVKEKFVKKWQK